jgi:hypothetical protein
MHPRTFLHMSEATSAHSLLLRLHTDFNRLQCGTHCLVREPAEWVGPDTADPLGGTAIRTQLLSPLHTTVHVAIQSDPVEVGAGP